MGEGMCMKEWVGMDIKALAWIGLGRLVWFGYGMALDGCKIPFALFLLLEIGRAHV